jgi:predicted site-specific integrase-resolvase
MSVMVKGEKRVEPDLVPIKDFAERLGVSIWTARSWVYQGRISSCKISRSVLIPTTEVSRLICENLRPRIA